MIHNDVRRRKDDACSSMILMRNVCTTRADFGRLRSFGPPPLLSWPRPPSRPLPFSRDGREQHGGLTGRLGLSLRSSGLSASSDLLQSGQVGLRLGRLACNVSDLPLDDHQPLKRKRTLGMHLVVSLLRRLLLGRLSAHQDSLSVESGTAHLSLRLSSAWAAFALPLPAAGFLWSSSSLSSSLSLSLSSCILTVFFALASA